ncbi:MAG: GTPase Era [Firmicutes bacterium]|nr:GTPase Era [Bacillota bacterium]
MKSGFVSIIGRPNVGKSTLLNNIIGKKIAITSNKPQTTRNIIQGIYNEDDTQIVFVDTPGIHKPKHKLGNYLNKQSYMMIEDVDVVLFMVDASEGLGSGDKFILERLKTINKSVILILNKIDKLSNDEILLKIDEYKDLYDFAEIIPLSSLKNKNVDRLIEVLKKYMTDEIKYFDENTITNVKTSFIISEYVREKVLELTNEEVPHSVTCLVENIEYKKNIVNIQVCIIVDRDNLKKIIIGKNGEMLKKIGTMARHDIEKYLDKKIYLELYVKSVKNWRDKEKYLQEFGFKDFE